MNIRSLSAGLVLGVVIAAGVGAAFQQNPPPGGVGGGGGIPKGVKPVDAAAAQKSQQDEMQKMMQAWTDASTPGEQHAMLLKSVGNYDMVTKVWMAGPDAPPTEYKGTSEIKSVLNGHFILQTDHNAYPKPDMNTGEMKLTPMEGMGLFGYDNFQRMYVGCWADSLNTYILNMRGVMSPDGKTLTMYGEMDEAMIGVRGRTVKYVTHHVSDDNYTFTIYDLAVGDDHKAVEVEYTRKK